MTPQVILEIGGMLLFASGMWRFESRPFRTAATLAVTLLLCLAGLAAMTLGAIQAGSNWTLNLSIVAMYSAAATFLSGAAAALLARHRAGSVLATLGTGVTGGFKIVSAVAAVIGILATTMQVVNALKTEPKPGLMLFLIGQTLFFLASGVRAGLISTSTWLLTEGGILGPSLFIPWQQASAYDWPDSSTIGISTACGASTPRRLTIPVIPEAHDRAAAILAIKLPGHAA